MKKSLTAFAACVLAGAVFAQVESKNIVGYQTIPLTQNGYTFTCATLAPIGMVGGTMLLGDIKANANFALFEDSIQIFNAAGARVLTATYVSREILDENELFEVEDGWYDLDDVDLEGPTYNDTELAYGTSLTVFTGYADAGLLYVGEVIQQDVSVTLAQNAYTFLGNASPVNLTLGDIKANENFALFEDSIQIFNAAGARVLTATYVSREILDENELFEVEDGWYDLDDVDLEGPTYNDTAIIAGQGMTVFTGYPGAEIIIPNPML